MHCNQILPPGLTVCFRCGKSPQMVVQNTQNTQPLLVKKKSRALPAIIASLSAVLVLGGVIGGHFLDLYTLPFLPEPSGNNNDNGKSRSRCDICDSRNCDDDCDDDEDDTRPASGGIREDRDRDLGDADAPRYDDDTSPAPVSYSLPHIELHVNESNPHSGTLTLKNHDIPGVISVGLYDTATYGGMIEVLFGVSMASEYGYLYEITSHRWSGDGGTLGDMSVLDLPAQIFGLDVVANNVKTDVGEAWLIDATRDSITWEFIFNENANIDLYNLTYFGYDIKEYDYVNLERTYKRSGGSWDVVGDFPVYVHFREIASS
jgi:hypothetical protein